MISNLHELIAIVNTVQNKCFLSRMSALQDQDADAGGQIHKRERADGGGPFP